MNEERKKKTIKELIIKLSKNQKIQQSSILYLSNLVTIPLGILTSIIVTRFLGAKHYGDYMFLNSIFTFAVIVLTFGFYQAANRALVLNKNRNIAKEYYGATLFITVFLYAIFVISLIIYTWFDSNIEQKGLINILYILLPFCFVYFLLKFFETLFQADNQIHLLAISRVGPKLGYLIGAIALYFLLSEFEGNRQLVVWIAFLLPFIIVYFIVLIKLRVKFSNIYTRLKEIWYYNKTFGLHVYLGSLFALGFAQLTNILISYFSIENSGVGFFSLAITLASPLSFIPNVIATTYYKDFASKTKIPIKLILLTVLLSLISLILLWIIVGPFVRIFYGSEFQSVVKLNYIVSVGLVFHGLGDFFNRFLGAHGKGKSLRNSSIIYGFVLMMFNLILIPKYGEFGASITKLVTGILYFSLMIIYYFRLTVKLNS